MQVLCVGGQVDGNAGRSAARRPSGTRKRGQFWVRRFQRQADGLCPALAALTAPMAAPNFITRALHMCQAVGWTAAHRFLFSGLRAHLLGWPRFLVPHGRRAALRPALSST